MEDPAVAEDAKKSRLKKVQEKNKRAQARYRQKQKEKMQNFEGECVRLAEELDELRAAHSRLEVENSRLAEQVSRQRTMGAPHGQATQQPFRPQPVVAPPAAAPGPGGWARLPSAAGQFWSQTLREITSRRLSEDQAAAVDASPLSHGGMFPVYKAWVEELEARLAAVEREQSAEAVKAVGDVILALRAMRHVYTEGQSHLERVQGATGLLQEARLAHGAPTAEHWKKALAWAGVSPAQRGRILALRSKHLGRMEAITRARKDVVWELQQATVVPETMSLRQAAFMKAVQQANQLQESLIAECLAREEFMHVVCHQVLTELQEARMLVACFPHFTDMAAICDLLATEPEAAAAAAAASESDEGAEAAAGAAALPGSLQAAAGSELAPDLLASARAWGCGVQQNGTSQPQIFPVAPGFAQPSGGFSGGGHGSGFAPLPRSRVGP